MRVTLLTIGAGPVGAAGANKMATACKTDYCAYDHAGNIIGVLLRQLRLTADRQQR